MSSQQHDDLQHHDLETTTVSSSLSDNTSDTSDTHSSVREPVLEMSFPSASQLQAFLQNYAEKTGFAVTHRSHSHSGMQRGSWHCHCFEESSLKSDQTPRKVYHVDTGKVKCGCKWKVNYRVKSGQWIITSYDSAQNGHYVHTPQPILADPPMPVRRVTDITSEMMRDMQDAMLYNTPTRSYLQAHIEGRYHVLFDDELFRNTFRQLQSLHAPPRNEHDWKDTVKWATGQEGSFCRYDMEPTTKRGTRLLYISPTMSYNFRRNGEVVFMDTSHGTNKYRYYLLLLSGISHYGHTVILAAALLRQQRAEDFSWVFEEIKNYLGDVWYRIQTVVTDGDGAMRNALQDKMPHAFQLRCVWHIQKNIEDKITEIFGKHYDAKEVSEFQSAVSQIIWSVEETESNSLREELHRKYPAAASYLINNIWPNAELFCTYSVQKRLTFNAQSTQRAESLHSLIKRDNKYGQRLAINTSAQQLFRLLHDTALTQDKANMERDRKELQHAKVYQPFHHSTFIVNIDGIVLTIA